MKFNCHVALVSCCFYEPIHTHIYCRRHLKIHATKKQWVRQAERKTEIGVEEKYISDTQTHTWRNKMGDSLRGYVLPFINKKNPVVNEEAVYSVPCSLLSLSFLMYACACFCRITAGAPCEIARFLAEEGGGYLGDKHVFPSVIVFKGVLHLSEGITTLLPLRFWVEITGKSISQSSYRWV